MLIKPEIIKDIVAHGNKEFPKEACGLILESPEGNQLIRQCQNQIQDPYLSTNNFQMPPMEIINMERAGFKVLMIYHTHCLTPPIPSIADRYGCKVSGYPWLILNPTTEFYTITQPNELPPEFSILGREFVWGMWDCYGLVRDIYKQQLSIDLPDLDRGIFGVWDYEPGWDKFEENFKEAGFIKTPFSHSRGMASNNFKKYDVILLNVRNESGKANHCGILMDEEYQIFYHHLYNSLSSKSVYGSSWMLRTTAILRHKFLWTES